MTDAVPDWVPASIDLSKPSAARMYDYYLGGAHNFAVDRDLARQVLALYPNGQLMAQANRAFLHRAVRFLAGQGVRQFIDVGSGIPTEGNVHETAELAGQSSRVLYVDHDPVAVAHGEILLNAVPNAGVLKADVRDPLAILSSPELATLIDLSEPVAILIVAVLHFIPDEDRPGELIRRFQEAVAPGSYLVMSHAINEAHQDEASAVTELYKTSSDPGVTYRTRAG